MIKVYAYGKEICRDWNSNFSELACCKYIYIIQQKPRFETYLEAKAYVDEHNLVYDEPKYGE